MSKTCILVIDDDSNVLDLTQFHLRKKGYEISTAASGEEGMALLNDNQYDLVLTDLRLPDLHGIELVKHVKENTPETEIIVITGYSSVTQAVEATKAGAFYFVEKPVNYDELLILIEKALERRQQAGEIRQLRDRMSRRTSYYNIIGSSRAMQDIYEIIDSVAESDANVLIIGESGTGKELVANAMHYKSLRSKKPFVKINCAALPKELIESELFGHSKGAFTGAAKDKVGLVGQADGGSLLMDEIGEMPLELQPKLLRVLQERMYRPVGSEKSLDVDFRLISATNRDPIEAVRSGQLREDLYYRINTIEIHVPPLRDREEDVQRLAEYFLQQYAEKYNRPTRGISQDAYEQLFAYQWPGNVRELQNVMERAVLMSRGETIESSALPLKRSGPLTMPAQTVSQPASGAAAASAAAASAAEPEQNATSEPPDFEELCRLMVEQLEVPNGKSDAPNIFGRLEGALVKYALERTRGNKQAAANLLGLYRPRLYSIIKKHNLPDVTPEI